MQMVQPLQSTQVLKLIKLQNGTLNVTFQYKNFNINLNTGAMTPQSIKIKIYWRKSKKWVAMSLKFLSWNNPGLSFRVKYW